MNPRISKSIGEQLINGSKISKRTIFSKQKLKLDSLDSFVHHTIRTCLSKSVHNFHPAPWPGATQSPPRPRRADLATWDKYKYNRYGWMDGWMEMWMWMLM